MSYKLLANSSTLEKAVKAVNDFFGSNGKYQLIAEFNDANKL